MDVVWHVTIMEEGAFIFGQITCQHIQIMPVVLAVVKDPPTVIAPADSVP